MSILATVSFQIASLNVLARSWPPYSTDLNPCDYCLWGYLKDNVYRNNPHTVHEMKRETEAAVIKIIPDILGRVLVNF
jgi:hypothetical protein